MDRFQLNLSNDDYTEVNDLKRKHKTLIIRDFLWNFMDISCIQNINSLKLNSQITNKEFLKLSELVQALSNLPMLKIFDALYVWFIQDTPIEKDFKKVCKNLTELKCTAEILFIFECKSLENFEMFCNREISSERKMIAHTFLAQQKDLSSLTLLERSEQDDFCKNFEDFHFRLKSLNYSSTALTLNYYEFLIKFLWTQKDSLENLTINLNFINHHKEEHFHDFILRNMPYLKELSFRVMVDRILGMKQLEIDGPQQVTDTTRSIERLCITPTFYSLDDSKRIVDLFPNIKHLTIATLPEFEFLKHVSITKTTIESISFSHFNDDHEQSYFPNLKELSIFCARCKDEAFREFIHRHSKTLEKLAIDIITSLTAAEIIKCENLKQLCLKVCSDTDLLTLMDQFNEISNRTRPTTIILQCISKCWLSTYKFPEDKIFWDAEIEKLKSNDVQKSND